MTVGTQTLATIFRPFTYMFVRWGVAGEFPTRAARAAFPPEAAAVPDIRALLGSFWLSTGFHLLQLLLALRSHFLGLMLQFIFPSYPSDIPCEPLPVTLLSSSPLPLREPHSQVSGPFFVDVRLSLQLTVRPTCHETETCSARFA